MRRLFLGAAAWSARLLPAAVKRGLYRWRPLANAIRGVLNRAAPQGLTLVEVAAGGLAGYRLYLDLQTEKDYWLGTYEPELQSALKVLAQPGWVAFDVGANIGYITLLLQAQVGPAGKVFAFEALPANLERLRLNLQQNGLADAVQVVPAAVVDSGRPVRFLIGPSGGMGKAEGSAGRTQVAYEGVLQVDGLALDDFVYRQGNPPPQLVKMDIEGGEVLALPGMRQVLHQARPVMLLELHGPEAAQAAWRELRAAGYRLCQMSSGFPEAEAVEHLDWKAYLVGFPPGFMPGGRHD